MIRNNNILLVATFIAIISSTLMMMSSSSSFVAAQTMTPTDNMSSTTTSAAAVSTSTMPPPTPTTTATPSAYLLVTLINNNGTASPSFISTFTSQLATMLNTPESTLMVMNGQMDGTLIVQITAANAAALAAQTQTFSASQLSSLGVASISQTTAPTTMTSTTVSETSTTEVSVSGTTVSSMTTATSTEEPTTTPTPTVPSVYLLITLANGTVINTDAERLAFRDKLAGILNISSSFLTVTQGPSPGTLTVQVTAANASAIGEEAKGLDAGQLASLGAASIAEAPAPVPTTAEPAPKKLNIPLIAGAAGGGLLLLLILLYIAKKKSSGGSGQDSTDAGHVTSHPVNDGATFRRMEDEMNTHRDRQSKATDNVL